MKDYINDDLDKVLFEIYLRISDNLNGVIDNQNILYLRTTMGDVEVHPDQKKISVTFDCEPTLMETLEKHNINIKRHILRQFILEGGRMMVSSCPGCILDYRLIIDLNLSRLAKIGSTYVLTFVYAYEYMKPIV